MPSCALARLAAHSLLAGAVALATVPAQAATVPLPPPSANAGVEVFFSPGANTDQAIASAILSAKKRVWLVGYYFTSTTIAKALHEIHKRDGVDVRIILDRSQATAKYSSATYFHNQGVPLKINARYPILHQKFFVIDSDIVGFGSMNFTKAGARENAENFNIFRRWSRLAETYAKEFSRLDAESVAYRPGMTFDQADAGIEGRE